MVSVFNATNTLKHFLIDQLIKFFLLDNQILRSSVEWTATYIISGADIIFLLQRRTDIKRDGKFIFAVSFNPVFLFVLAK